MNHDPNHDPNHDHWPGVDLEHLPGPTPWPLVLGLGMTLLGAGTVIDPFRFVGLGISIVGLALFATALVVLIREDIRLWDRGQP
jgi:hypothetical protein